MRKPPKNFEPRKKEVKKSAAELFDLCWYDSLIEEKNKHSSETAAQVQFSMKRNSQAVPNTLPNLIPGGVTSDDEEQTTHKKDEDLPEPPSNTKSALNQVLR